MQHENQSNSAVRRIGLLRLLFHNDSPTSDFEKHELPDIDQLAADQENSSDLMEARLQFPLIFSSFLFIYTTFYAKVLLDLGTNRGEYWNVLECAAAVRHAQINFIDPERREHGGRKLAAHQSINQPKKIRDVSAYAPIVQMLVLSGV